MGKDKITALIIVALALVPLRMLNMNEGQLLPSNMAEKASADAGTSIEKAVYTVESKINVWITAYASVPEETDSTPFITASNKHVKDGFIAANFLPFGTKVKIPNLFGDKVFTVEDRMSRDKTNFVDIWMPTVSAAKDFGIHKASIVVLGDSISGNVAER